MSEPQENRDVRYEKTDVDARAALGFAIGLGVGLAVVMGGVWVMFRSFDRSEVERKKSEYPLAVSLRKQTSALERLPTLRPRIEGIPVGDPEYTFGRYGPPSAETRRAAEDKILGSYGWVDENNAIARIPIHEAMKRLTAQEGKKP